MANIFDHMRQSGMIDELCRNPQAALKIKDQSPLLQMALVEHNPINLKFLYHPTKAVKKRAVELDGRVIMFIKSPSEEVQLAAIKNTTEALTYINSPSRKVQLTAVKLYANSIFRINRPHRDVQFYIYMHRPDLLHLIIHPCKEIVNLMKQIKEK